MRSTHSHGEIVEIGVPPCHVVCYKVLNFRIDGRICIIGEGKAATCLSRVRQQVPIHQEDSILKDSHEEHHQWNQNKSSFDQSGATSPRSEILCTDHISLSFACQGELLSRQRWCYLERIVAHTGPIYGNLEPVNTGDLGR